MSNDALRVVERTLYALMSVVDAVEASSGPAPLGLIDRELGVGGAAHCYIGCEYGVLISLPTKNLEARRHVISTVSG